MHDMKIEIFSLTGEKVRQIRDGEMYSIVLSGPATKNDRKPKTVTIHNNATPITLFETDNANIYKAETTLKSGKITYGFGIFATSWTEPQGS